MEISYKEALKIGEYQTIKQLLEKYSTGIISLVSDSYDYWAVLTEILPKLKTEIMARQPDAMGFNKVVIRPDSGDPVRIIAGYRYGVYSTIYEVYDSAKEIKKAGYEVIVTTLGKVYEVEWIGEETFDGYKETMHLAEVELTIEEVKGSIQVLWELFGGTINDKGYKTLDQHIGLIYGDSITLSRADEILGRLEAKGFSADNVVFGVGSYTYSFVTRDTLGFAMKMTNIIKDGKSIPLFKDPKTGDGMKKSAKGLLCVMSEIDLENDTEKYVLINDVDREMEEKSLLTTLFKDGKFYKHETFEEIRNRLKGL